MGNKDKAYANWLVKTLSEIEPAERISDSTTRCDECNEPLPLKHVARGKGLCIACTEDLVDEVDNE